MDFRFTPEEEAFRMEVRQFIEREVPPEHRSFVELGGGEEDLEEATAFNKQFAKKLASKGWLVMAWPKEYGGGGATHVEQLIFNEEMAYSGAPPVGTMGKGWVGPSIMVHGTEEQKKEHLPRITNADVEWSTGFSEPGAGSDLAALQTRAVLDGDFFVVNGQKIWTSGAQGSDWCWLAVRTDPNAPKHKGISILMADMKTPGITIRPLINMADVAGFCEVFWDDVKIPKKNLVGPLNGGWYVTAAGLDFERMAVAPVAGTKRLVEDLVRYAEEMQAAGHQVDTVIRHRLAEMMIECEVARMFGFRVCSMQMRGTLPNYEASMGKLFNSELQQRVGQVGMQLLGMTGQIHAGSKWAPLTGRVTLWYLSTVGITLASGTSEIQRNVIAQRGLDLPRG